MLKYKRKPNSGKMHMMQRSGGHKGRVASHVVFKPGDEIAVPSKEDLPGWPHSVDGWELVGTVGEESSSTTVRKQRTRQPVGAV